MELPTLKQLRYLVALQDHLHFGRAARACHVTQPALSDQLRQLEELLGVQLVERSRRGVIFTPAGQRMADRARGILSELGEMVELTRRGGEPLHAPVRLGVIPTVAPYVLPPMLGNLRRRHPALKLYLREEKTGTLIRYLNEGRLDVLMLALPLDDGHLETLELYQEQFVLVAPSAHPLARKKTVSQADLIGQPVMLLEEGHCLRDQALELCGADRAVESEGFRASSLGTLIQMVANDMGITLLPQLAVEVELRRTDELAAIPFKGTAPRRTIGLAWRRASARAEEYRLLGAAVREMLPAEALPAEP